MAEQNLKDVANEALISLIENVTQAAQFLKGEVPIAVQELLTYYTAFYALLILAGVAGIALVIYAARKIHQFFEGELGEALFAGFLVLSAPATGSLWAVGHIVDLLKVTLAPRIWLLEYAAGLVR